jgi:hypothetical protein
MLTVAYFGRWLMLALLASVGVVPGNLVVTVCLCRDVRTTPVVSGASCGMACCEPSHERAPEGPAIANSSDVGCPACHRIKSGEREPLPSLASTVDLSNELLPCVPAALGLPSRIVVEVRAMCVRGTSAPPGQTSNLPLRI